MGPWAISWMPNWTGLTLQSFQTFEIEELMNMGTRHLVAVLTYLFRRIEKRLMLKQLEHVATLPTIRLGMRLYLLTMVRKSELQDAVWDEVDFENAVWTIPKERMKRSKAHNVYLSRQVLDIMIALKTCAGNSKYLLPSRYDADAPMSRATFNRVTYAVVERAKAEGLPLEPFTVHDLRRTGSTLLNELGFNSDWIEKCLAHEDGRSSRWRL